jgi:hypothetical protein
MGEKRNKFRFSVGNPERKKERSKEGNSSESVGVDGRII